MEPMNILVLGGTTEATALARLLAERRDVQPTLSLAGRTLKPERSPLPTRIGGFGGVYGLATYLRENAVEAVVDATHPFAAQMSGNAVEACQAAGVPLARLIRVPWEAETGDRWIAVESLPAAAEALRTLGERIFLSVGRQSLKPFEAVPEKGYLVRTVDPPEPPPDFPRWTLVQDRGPFTLDGELRLLREHGIEAVVTKNSGGTATRAKLEAARVLGLPVVVVKRPALPPADAEFHEAAKVLDWLDGLHSPPSR